MGKFTNATILQEKVSSQYFEQARMHRFFWSSKEQFAAIEARIYYPNFVSETALEVAEQSNASKPKNRTGKGRKSKAEQQPDITESQNLSRLDLETEKDTSTSGDEPRDGDVRSHQLNRRKRKSILQPTGSKYSKKAAGRRRSIPLIDQTPAKKEDGVDGVDDDSTSEENSPLPSAKHQDFHLSSHTRANQPLSTSSPAAYHTYYPGKYHGIKVVKYDVPSNRPQGPGDLWTCTFKACGHRVHEGSTANGIERIKAHFETHTHQAQEKIDLAYKESRPYLPVEYVCSLSHCCSYANYFKETLFVASKL